MRVQVMWRGPQSVVYGEWFDTRTYRVEIPEWMHALIIRCLCKTKKTRMDGFSIRKLCELGLLAKIACMQQVKAIKCGLKTATIGTRAGRNNYVSTTEEWVLHTLAWLLIRHVKVVISTHFLQRSSRNVGFLSLSSFAYAAAHINITFSLCSTFNPDYCSNVNIKHVIHTTPLFY